MTQFWKVTVDRMQDTILLCQTHTRHHEDLFLNFLSRLTEAEKESSATIEDDLGRGLASAYSGWADGTIMVLGFVAAYHLWERQVTEVLVEQFARRKEKPPSKKTRPSFVSYVRETLRTQFGISRPDEVWTEIDRSRMIVNAYKHGVESADYERAKEAHPQFFTDNSIGVSGQGYSDIAITREQFAALMRCLSAFWDDLPYEVNYRAIVK